MAVPKPGPAATEGAYAPQPILPGGVVIPLFPPDSPYLKADKIREPEQYNMSQAVPGRIQQHRQHSQSVDRIPPGRARHQHRRGGHPGRRRRTQHAERRRRSADFVPFFYNYGVNTVILRNRLRRDGYNPQTDEVYDAMQAIRMVRAYAKEWNLDPNKIGIMGFSAGAELATPPAVLFEDFDKKNNAPDDPLAGISARPDFVGIIYPGPTPFARNRTAPPIPKNVPPAFVVCGGSGDRGHAVWAIEYFSAMLAQGVPNIEMHIYGNGRHPGRPAARRQPHVRRPDRPQRHPVRHLAVSLHRLVPRSRLPAEARRRDQGREGHRRLHRPAAAPRRPGWQRPRQPTRDARIGAPAAERQQYAPYNIGSCRTIPIPTWAGVDASSLPPGTR